jgi:hypothetical protein
MRPMSQSTEPDPVAGESDVAPEAADVAIAEPLAAEEPTGLSWRDRIALLGWTRSLLLALALTALILGG